LPESATNLAIWLRTSFERHGFKPSDRLNTDILKTIMQNGKKAMEESILVQFYKATKDNLGWDPTVNEFILEIVNNLDQFQLTIKKLFEYKKKCQDNINELEDVLKVLRDHEYELDIPSKDRNTVKLRYLKEEENEINRKYKIKYRASTNLGTMANIRNDSKPSKCVLPITLNTELVYIEITKQVRADANGSKIMPVTIKNLPLYEVFTSFRPEYYTGKAILQTYLLIPFEDDDPTSDITQQEVEIEFTLNLDFEFREKKLIEFIEKWRFNKLKVEKKIDTLIHDINDAIQPFTDMISYDVKAGFSRSSKDDKID